MNNELKKNTLFCLVILLALVALSACGGGSSSSPTTVPSSATIFYAHNLVFKNSTTILSTGYNGFGQLGTGNLGNRSVPAGLDKYYPFRGFAAGGNHSVAFTNNSSVVYSWGYNGFGQLGNELTTFSNVPVRTGTITGVTAVAAGAFHTLALKNDTVWAWGSNDVGQLGIDSASTPLGYITAPTKISAGGVIFSNISAIAANGKHSLALADGKVWAWGLNGSGQLGIDPKNTGALVVPTALAWTHTSGPASIAAGSAFNFAVARDGALLAWGNNDNGQLGNGTTISGFSPALVMTAAGSPLQGVVQAVAGIQHGLARLSNGEVWAWGYNFYGQLGNNIKLDSNAKPDSPYAVQVLLGVSGAPLTGATDIRAFGSSSMAMVDGVWYVWGDNSFGQLGVGTSLKITIPEKMTGI